MYLCRRVAERGKAVLPRHATLKDECFRAVLQDITIACRATIENRELHITYQILTASRFVLALPWVQALPLP